MSVRREVIGDAELWLGDCRDLLPEMQADAVITDPPYGMNFDTDSRRFTNGGTAGETIVGDDSDFDPTPWLRFDRVILWGANHYAERLPRGTTLVWLKRYPEHYGTFLSDAEVGWQRGGYGVYVFNAPDSAGRRKKEFTGSAFGGATAHKFQKPIALMEWCAERLQRPARILDPFMGSGTTGVAALRLGRKFIGVEIEQRWFDIACRRIEAEARQTRLPIDEPARPNSTQTTLFERASDGG